MAASVHTCYISSSCNRVPHCADWGRNDLICYGSCNSVAIYRPENGSSEEAAGTVCMLAGHTDRVNSVRWIPTPGHAKYRGKEFVSCSVDKTAILWYYCDGKYEKRGTLVGHTGSVTVACAVYLSFDPLCQPDKEQTLIVTASADSTVRVWQRNPGCQEVKECQMLTFGTGFALDVSLILIPGLDVPLLACGVDDHKVHLFVRHGSQFTEVMKLTGHEDWVQGVHLTVDDCNDIMLASCAQDQLIRIWRLAARETDTGTSTASIKQLAADEDIKMKEKTFSFIGKDDKQKFYAVILESVLSGHEGWIYSVRWQPQIVTDEKMSQPMRLLSASMDKTMIVWSPDPDSGVWVEQVRVGEVGGNTLGLYGGLFSPDGKSILAHGYQGALHQWIHSTELNTWEPAVTGGGHFASIEDMDWDRGGGNFVLTASLDQTTRLHAPWVKDGRYLGWYEIARPQIHGYDMECLTMINSYTFASAGDEKVVRVFQAPRNFIENLCRISGLDLADKLAEEEVSQLPEGASVPALGLSNKAVFDSSQSAVGDDRLIPAQPNEQYADVYFSPVSLTAPPSEEHLLQNTLWPEIHKLYGHGYEVFALAADPAGKLLASSCKASRPEHANILLWDTATWQKVASLEGNSLTVVQMAWSPSGQYLLAVSRDRTWSLYKHADGSFPRVSFVDKKTTPHSRIIWACAWSHDGRFFFTASRDKKVVVWSLEDVCQSQPPKAAAVLEMKDSVTAVDVAPLLLSDNRYLIATGQDGGQVTLHTWSLPVVSGSGDGSSFTSITLDPSHHHQLTVKRVRFRPVTGLAGHSLDESEKNRWLQLATCGADHCLRIHNIDLTKLTQDCGAENTSAST